MHGRQKTCPHLVIVAADLEHLSAPESEAVSELLWVFLVGNVVMTSKQMGQSSGYMSKLVVARKAQSAMELHL